MRRFVLAAMLLAISVAAPTAQDALTTNQRDTDLVQLASMFAKNYAPDGSGRSRPAMVRGTSPSEQVT